MLVVGFPIRSPSWLLAGLAQRRTFLLSSVVYGELLTFRSRRQGRGFSYSTVEMKRRKHVDRVEEFWGNIIIICILDVISSGYNSRVHVTEGERMRNCQSGTMVSGQPIHRERQTDRQRALMICRRYLFISSSSCSPSIQRARDNLIPQMAFITVHSVTQ